MSRIKRSSSSVQYLITPYGWHWVHGQLIIDDDYAALLPQRTCLLEYAKDCMDGVQQSFGFKGPALTWVRNAFESMSDAFTNV